jgi:hypothetical protein
MFGLSKELRMIKLVKTPFDQITFHENEASLQVSSHLQRIEYFRKLLGEDIPFGFLVNFRRCHLNPVRVEENINY